jgi:hypothetical protein
VLSIFGFQYRPWKKKVVLSPARASRNVVSRELHH